MSKASQKNFNKYFHPVVISEIFATQPFLIQHNLLNLRISELRNIYLEKIRENKYCKTINDDDRLFRLAVDANNEFDHSKHLTNETLKCSHFYRILYKCGLRISNFQSENNNHKTHIFKAEEIRNQEIRNQEIRNQEIRNPEIRNQEIRNQEIRNQEIRNQEIRNVDPRRLTSDYRFINEIHNKNEKKYCSPILNLIDIDIDNKYNLSLILGELYAIKEVCYKCFYNIILSVISMDKMCYSIFKEYLIDEYNVKKNKTSASLSDRAIRLYYSSVLKLILTEPFIKNRINLQLSGMQTPLTQLIVCVTRGLHELNPIYRRTFYNEFLKKIDLLLDFESDIKEHEINPYNLRVRDADRNETFNMLQWLYGDKLFEHAEKILAHPRMKNMDLAMENLPGLNILYPIVQNNRIESLMIILDSPRVDSDIPITILNESIRIAKELKYHDIHELLIKYKKHRMTTFIPKAFDAVFNKNRDLLISTTNKIFNQTMGGNYLPESFEASDSTSKNYNYEENIEELSDSSDSSDSIESVD